MKNEKVPDGTYVLKANSYGVSGEQIKLPGAAGADNLVAFSVSGESNWGLCLRPSVTSGVTGSGSDTISQKETKFWKNLKKEQKEAIALAMYL